RSRQLIVSRPESAARNLMRVGFARYPIGQMRDAAGGHRRLPPRKTRDGEVEPSPEKMHGAALADEAGAKLLQHPVSLSKHVKEPAPRLGRIRSVRGVLLEWDRFDHFAGSRADCYAEAELCQTREQLFVELGDRAGAKRHCARHATAGLDQEAVIDEIE